MPVAPKRMAFMETSQPRNESPGQRRRRAQPSSSIPMASSASLSGSTLRRTRASRSAPSNQGEHRPGQPVGRRHAGPLLPEALGEQGGPSLEDLGAGRRQRRRLVRGLEGGGRHRAAQGELGRLQLAGEHPRHRLEPAPHVRLAVQLRLQRHPQLVAQPPHRLGGHLLLALGEVEVERAARRPGLGEHLGQAGRVVALPGQQPCRDVHHAFPGVHGGGSFDLDRPIGLVIWTDWSTD